MTADFAHGGRGDGSAAVSGGGGGGDMRNGSGIGGGLGIGNGRSSADSRQPEAATTGRTGGRENCPFPDPDGDCTLLRQVDDFLLVSACVDKLLAGEGWKAPVECLRTKASLVIGVDYAPAVNFRTTCLVGQVVGLWFGLLRLTVEEFLSASAVNIRRKSPDEREATWQVDALTGRPTERHREKKETETETQIGRDRYRYIYIYILSMFLL